MEIQPFIKTDITALKSYNGYILAGIGRFLYMFDKTCFKRFHKTEVFFGNKIHGVLTQKNEKQIVIYGGKVFRIASIDIQTNTIKFHTEILVCNDWIQYIQWYNDKDIAVLTSHNTVQIWNLDRGTPSGIFKSKDNSILYSGSLFPLENDMLVFGGTVFSQVIIRSCKEDEKLQVLKGHKGVIFSIAWNPIIETIVTTSDDRSIRIWGPSETLGYSPNDIKYWKINGIICKKIMFGHLARVLRCTLTNDTIVSVGEDSFICFWDINGELIRKIKSHQDGCIWSVDCDQDYSLTITGGGDSALNIHPLNIPSDDIKSCTLPQYNDTLGNPKKIAFTSRGNIVSLSDNNYLVYYDFELNCWSSELELPFTNSFKLLAMSSCKQLIAIVDKDGNLCICAETCKNEVSIKPIVYQRLVLNNILSMHWAGNRHIVFCGNKGNIIVVRSESGGEAVTIEEFILPHCKERWLTSVAKHENGSFYVLGDRCGGLHLYSCNSTNPLHTITKIHGHLGVNSIYLNGDLIKTTGRDGSVKYFKIDSQNKMKYLHCEMVPFIWLERFVDRDEALLCGFKEHNFVLYDMQNKCTVLDINCSGGHRLWDVTRTWIKNCDSLYETIKFIYTKNCVITYVTIIIDNVKSTCVLSGYHSKEINCLTMLHADVTDKLGNSGTIIISGGEDTTLRISTLCNGYPDTSFIDIKVFKHISSVRALTIHQLSDCTDQSRIPSNELLLISGGGRAQICINKLKISNNNKEINILVEEILNYQNKSTTTNSLIEIPQDMRIMSLCSVNVMETNSVLIFAGCSDSYLRVYNLSVREITSVRLVSTFEHHKSCILKVHNLSIIGKEILLSISSDSEIVLWDITDLFKSNDEIVVKTSPIFTFKANNSGVNSFDFYNLSQDTVILATGGDDNAIHLSIIKFVVIGDKTSCCVESRWSCSLWHCAQITGLTFFENNLLLSASVDQRLTLAKWNYENSVIKCTFVKQYYTDVADVQGLSVIPGKTSACVFGKGIEVLNIEA